MQNKIWQLFVFFKMSLMLQYISLIYNEDAKNGFVENIKEHFKILEGESPVKITKAEKGFDAIRYGSEQLLGIQDRLENIEDSQLNPIQMKNKKFIALLNDAISSEIPDLLFVMMEHYEKMPSSKRGTFNQLKNEFESPPNNFQLNGWKARLKVFISGLDFEIDYPKKTTDTMAHGIEKEIEGLKEVVDLLLEKKKYFLNAQQTAYDIEQKFALSKQLEEIKGQLNDYHSQIKELESRNSNKVKAEGGDELNNTILKEIEEIKKKNEKLQQELEEMKNNNNTNKKASMQTVKIFLASSSELKEDRRELREFFSIENDRMHEKGTYFKLIQWEHFLDTISDTRLQDEYNKALRDCDLVVGLFFTKAGRYTSEELEKAYQHFTKTGKPKILTYFKDAPVNMNDITEEVLSLLKMKKNLADKGHFYTSYKNIEGLKNHLKSQLEKLGYYD